MVRENPFANNFKPWRPAHKLAVVKAAPRNEVERLQRLLVRQEATIRQAFAQFVRSASNATVQPLLERGDVDGVLRLLDKYIAAFGTVTSTVFLNVGNAEATAWQRKLIAKAEPSVSITFNPGDALAAALMERNRLRLIVGLTKQQREATRAALVTGMQRGLGPEKVARLFRQSIGLTTTQLGYVANYQRALEQGNPSALDRALRDRRFDATVANVIDDNDVLSPSQIERMVGRYTENMRTMRAATIARTEGHRIMGQAQRNALDQSLEQVGISDGLVLKEWATHDDGRERASHRDANEQRRRLSEMFNVGGTHMMEPGTSGDPDEDINCRCLVLYTFANDATELAELLAE